MIAATEIRDLLRRSPFKPFTIHTSDGKALEIKHPHMTIVFKESVLVAEAQGDKLPERSQRIPLAHVTSLSVSEA